ncbi:hypothetical protein NP534_19320, partial [Pseudomonas sp. 39004]|nr:hypothetical protein [Pseudomonas sp. 39004]
AKKPATQSPSHARRYSQVAYAEGSKPVQLASALQERLHDSLETFHVALARRPRPVAPGVLNERLISARWSI